MMDRLDWGGTCSERYGYGQNYTRGSFSSKTDVIMSKYRRIAPKPSPNVHANQGDTTSNLSSSSDSRSIFTMTDILKGNRSTESGGRPSRSRRRGATDCSDYSPSPKAQAHKRAKPPNHPIDLRASEKSTHISAVTSVPANVIVDPGPKIVYAFDGSFSGDKLNVEKDSGFMDRATAGDKNTAGFGMLNIEMVRNSSVEVGIQNHDVVSVQTMENNQCGCGSGKYLVFPIVNDSIGYQQKEKNLVTLSLLPEKPSMKDYAASNSVSTGHTPNMGNTSCDKEEFLFRLFGRDFSQREIGHWQN